MITLFYNVDSPVCRLVRIVFEELQIPVQVVNKSWLEILEPDFLKINPHHKLPTIVDGDFVLWESRSIICYLANKYKQNHLLYPSDPKLRAQIESWLHFDNGILYPCLESVCMPKMFLRQEGPLSPEETFKKHLRTMNILLNDRYYLCGDSRTFADLACLCSISYMESFDKEYILDGFPYVQKWLKNLKKELPYYQTFLQSAIDETKQGFAIEFNNPESELIKEYTRKLLAAEKHLYG